MKDDDIVVISRHMDFSKVMRYALDRLSKGEEIMLSAAVENADLFSSVRSHLTDVFMCQALATETGHFKVSGKHIPIVRCIIRANGLEFAREFRPIK